MNSNANYGFWVIPCQCKFISFKIGSTVISDVNKGAGNAWEGRGSVPSFQFFCESNTALKQ